VLRSATVQRCVIVCRHEGRRASALAVIVGVRAELVKLVLHVCDEPAEPRSSKINRPRPRSVSPRISGTVRPACSRRDLEADPHGFCHETLLRSAGASPSTTQAVLEGYHAAGHMAGPLRSLVLNQDDSSGPRRQPLEQLEHLGAGGRVEVSGSARRRGSSRLVTSARAIATRLCCWPPDSSDGWWWIRSASPTYWIERIARSRRRGARDPRVGQRQLDVGECRASEGSGC